MFILNSLREFVRTQGLDPSRPRGASRRAHRSRRLIIEALEDRLCLSTWSEPIDLGPVINGAGFDNRRPAISSDNLSLFFSSNRLGGGPDTGPLWVSHRASVDDPWGEPRELGPVINDPTATQTGAPNLSTDQHWLFFHSDGTNRGSEGGFDIFASYRPDTHDDFGWQTPINLGTGVNGPYNDNGPCYFEDPNTGTTTLYFNSDRPGGVGDLDFYASTLEGFGRFGPAVLVSELSSPYRDARMAIRSDGLEMFITSNRPGGLGTGLNIWVSTRASTLDPWSPPENLGAPINVDGYNDGAPALSADGNTMYFYSNRPGSLGANDLWMSTRQPTPRTFTVTNLHDSGPGSLRQAVLDANANPGADTVRFAHGLHGTITLTSGELRITDNLMIDGPGASTLAVSGTDASRVFEVTSGVTATIARLTIAHGLADNGGGIWNDGGHLNLGDVVVSDSEAVAALGQNAFGGGVLNQGGVLTVSASTFSGNRVLGGGQVNPTTFVFGRGGGIANVAGGTLTVSNSSFTENKAIGGQGGPGVPGGKAFGGGVSNTSGAAMHISHSAFSDNRAIGGAGGVAGGTGNSGRGAGINNEDSLSASVTYCTFTGNESVGGDGTDGGVGGGALGGGIANGAFTNGSDTALTVSYCTFSGNQAIAGAGAGAGASLGGGIVAFTFGSATAHTALVVLYSDFSGNQSIGGIGVAGSGGRGAGGAILNGSQTDVTVAYCTLTDNQAVGGAGAAGYNGGPAMGGGIENNADVASLNMSYTAISGNQAIGGLGGTGGNGGSADGGGISTASNAAISYCTITANQAIGGTGGAGGAGGNAFGGGITSDMNRIFTVSHVTIADNYVVGGQGGTGGNGGDGKGGGLYVDGATVTIEYSEITANQALGGHGGPGGADGQGLGGGIYINAGTVCVFETNIHDNHASTDFDDVFGDLC